MHDSEPGLPDDVPVADALEQQRTTADAPPGDDPDNGVPLESTGPDWQEQHQSVLIDPEPDEREQ